jgi:hypothetical protein
LSAGPRRGRRRWRVALLGTLTVGAAVACNSIAELDVNYSQQLRPDGSAPPDGALPDGDRRVRDSSYEASPHSIVDEYDGAALGNCDGGLASEALCDPSAGVGCCIRAGANLDEVQRRSACLQQIDFQLHCLANKDSPKAMFVACVHATEDSECCWRKQLFGENENRYAVYAKSCAQLEAGTACQKDEHCPADRPICNTRSCHAEITIGECRKDDGGGPPCP